VRLLGGAAEELVAVGCNQQGVIGMAAMADKQ
jgi:hypothetical protein